MAVTITLVGPELLAPTPVQAAVSDTAMRLPRHKERGPGPLIDVLALGDSYISGNGALKGGSNDGYYYKSPDDPRTDAEVRHKSFGEVKGNLATYAWLTKGCFRNHNSYAEQLYRQTGSTGAFINDSCSGDTTYKLTNLQAQHFTKAERNEIDLILLSIGGDNAKFSDLVRHCFVGWADNGKRCNADLDYAAEQMDDVVLFGQEPEKKNDVYKPSIKEVLIKLLTDFPNATIVLTGYPGLDQEWSLKLPYCPDSPWDSQENLAPFRDGSGKIDLTSPELRKPKNICDIKSLQYVYPAQGVKDLVDQASDYETDMVGGLRQKYGNRVFFHDLRGLYEGHNVGSKHPWIRDEGIVKSTKYYEEWFHPNAEGHSQTALELLNSDGGTDRALGIATHRDFPRMSVFKGDGSNGYPWWYAMDEKGRIWPTYRDFDQCVKAGGGYKKVTWPDPSLKFLLHGLPSPYELEPKLLGCDPNYVNGGDILREANGTAWAVQGKTRIHIPTGEMYNCLVSKGARVHNNVGPATLRQFTVLSALLVNYDPACPN